jgi:hypothetical protein
MDREEEAETYLKRAYDWIMLVADNTKNKTFRQSWLQNVKINQEILKDCAERGIAQ